MSIIAFRRYDDHIEVSADGRVMSEDKIISEDNKKIIQISNSLIIGATGLADVKGIFHRFVLANQKVFEEYSNKTEILPLFARFRTYLIDNYGYSEETIKELGGFLVVNKSYHGIYYYDDNLSPYCIDDIEYCDKGCVGSTRPYTSALLDMNMSPQDAIINTAKKYTSINDNVTTLTIEL